MWWKQQIYDPCLFLTGDCFFQMNWKLLAGPVHVSSQGLHCCASVVLQATKHPKSGWHPLAARKGTHHYFENTLFWLHHFKRSRSYVPLGLKYNENVCAICAIENSLVCETCNDEWQPPSWTIYVCFSHASSDPFETWHCCCHAHISGHQHAWTLSWHANKTLLRGTDRIKLPGLLPLSSGKRHKNRQVDAVDAHHRFANNLNSSSYFSWVAMFSSFDGTVRFLSVPTSRSGSLCVSGRQMLHACT